MRMDRIGQFRALFGGWRAHFLSPLRGLTPFGADTQGLRRGLYSFAASRLGAVAIACVLGISVAQAQSGGTQSQPSNQTQSPPNSQSSQDIPDAPSTVQPPAPKPAPEPETPLKPGHAPDGGQPSTSNSTEQGDQEKATPAK